MKTIAELEDMLAVELSPFITEGRSIPQVSKYYNEPLGDVSFILGGILKAHLKEKHTQWFVNGKWIDDTLIETFNYNYPIVEMSGVVIWGISGDTEQWTDPFRIVIELAKEGMAKYTILFGDVLRTSLKFSDFKYNRDYWKGSEPDWDYIILKKVR